jgi:DNA (cytosine-5)-methyltransferase 1
VISVAYARKGNVLRREVALPSRSVVSELMTELKGDDDPFVQWQVNFLRGNGVSPTAGQQPVSIGLVDLFCGCGGFSLGAMLASEALGISLQPLVGVDVDPTALEVYQRNIRPETVLCTSVSGLVDFQLWTEGGEMSFAQTPHLSPALAAFCGRADVVIGGPPCQGHSGFNNHTRSTDDRNTLYYTVPAIAIALNAKIAVVENVYNIVNDKFKVVQHSTSIFQKHGYNVTSLKLDASHYGVPQSRKRHFLIATRFGMDAASQIANALRGQSVTVGHAISDLEETAETSPFDRPARLSPENIARIQHLFANDIYHLPNEVRPDCHKNGHTYPSVYGRLKMDGVSNTVTTGFASPGRGRYVHPTRQRGLTPHEAARLQGFPDSFAFLDASGRDLTNKAYGKLIGDAVPPPLGLVPAVAALLSLPEFRELQKQA